MRIFVTLWFVFSLVSCGESGDGDGDGGGSTGGKSFTLSWIAPSEFENSDALVPADDLLEYRIYYGDSEENVTSNVEVVSSTFTSFTTSELDPLIIASILEVNVAMTSVSNDGVESVLSEIVKFNP